MLVTNREDIDLSSVPMFFVRTESHLQHVLPMLMSYVLTEQRGNDNRLTFPCGAWVVG